ncbi:MAG: cell wall metabolism sensor histidine kinase WalK, partial [Chloroflexia bacterium]|nr:cell wall metabolism sensor histidine kinase WalK [Chloroflexia bacterium]
MSIIGTVCFLISALFFFRYPSNIARPIKELTKGIVEIAKRNYSQRLDFQSNDELGELAKAFNIMAAKLDEFEHSNISELLFEKKRIDTIINNMTDAIIGLDNTKKIIFSNTYACQLININEQLLIGKYAPDVAVQNPVFHTIMNDVLENPDSLYLDFKPLRLILDEKVKYFSREILEVNITKTGETDSVRAGIVAVIKNVTRFLEQDEAKTNFIATISHELKTPISSLRLNLKLLNDNRIGSLNKEQKEIVEALRIESNKMLTITTELLDLAQVETGKIQFRLKQVSSTQLFDYVKDSLEDLAKTKQISVHYKVVDEVPPFIADLEKTGWVLINLVNNAVQYSSNSSQILITALKKKSEVIFSVEDFGKG